MELLQLERAEAVALLSMVEPQVVVVVVVVQALLVELQHLEPQTLEVEVAAHQTLLAVLVLVALVWSSSVTLAHNAAQAEQLHQAVVTQSTPLHPVEPTPHKRGKRIWHQLSKQTTELYPA